MPLLLEAARLNRWPWHHPSADRSRYGLGLIVKHADPDVGGKRIVGHSGYYPGFRSYAFYCPENGVCLKASIELNTSADGLVEQVAAALWEVCCRSCDSHEPVPLVNVIFSIITIPVTDTRRHYHRPTTLRQTP